MDVDIERAVALAPWAVEFRYADLFDAPPLDRAKAPETVVAVREWATMVIGADQGGRGRSRFDLRCGF